MPRLESYYFLTLELSTGKSYKKGASALFLFFILINDAGACVRARGLLSRSR